MKCSNNDVSCSIFMTFFSSFKSILRDVSLVYFILPAIHSVCAHRWQAKCPSLAQADVRHFLERYTLQGFFRSILEFCQSFLQKNMDQQENKQTAHTKKPLFFSGVVVSVFSKKSHHEENHALRIHGNQ